MRLREEVVYKLALAARRRTSDMRPPLWTKEVPSDAPQSLALYATLIL